MGPCTWAVCRATDAVAEDAVVAYSLRRQAFNQLLGPIEEVWKLEALRQVLSPDKP